MPLLRRLVVSEVDVSFVVDEMSLEQGFLLPFQVFLVNIIYQCSIVIHFSIAYDTVELLFSF
jgi:hypothetical protein